MGKTDARVRYTKFVLKRSLLQLLSRKPVNKITVKEVCEIADVGLPDTNRALTARVTPALILCGRGRYISPENAVIDIPLIEQIVDYINESNELQVDTMGFLKSIIMMRFQRFNLNGMNFSFRRL